MPKGYSENLEYRRRIVEQASGNAEAQDALWRMCSRDVLFFINVFCWTFNPKEYADLPVRPFITFGVQDDAIGVIDDHIGKSDVLIKKSREMGASWLILLVFLWRWMFKQNQNFLLTSRNQDYVDTPGNEKTLFAKLDFALARLPAWMQPRLLRTAHHLENLENGSKFDGESATSELGRGDRRTAMLWDEVAAWERGDGFRAMGSTTSVTNCRIINSTPRGTGDAYHLLSQSVKHQVRMHWTDHPRQRAGLYGSQGGVLRILDRSYEFPQGYEFVLDGQLRSPYKDEFCRRLPIASLVAQELEIDFTGSGRQFFDTTMIEKVTAEHCRAPALTGELAYDAQGYPQGFMESPGGTLKLWAPVSAKGPPRGMQACAGVDVSAGTGASNSAICVADRLTGEKVAELASNHIRPEEFARYSVALCRWFNDAFLTWEATGPGREYGPVVLECGYRNLYYHQDETRFPLTTSTRPGWFSTAGGKRALLTEYGIALARGVYVNRSKAAMDECAEIVYLDDGSIGHQASVAALDPSGSGENHADRVIADALTARGLRQRPTHRAETVVTPSYNTMDGRMALWEQEQRSQKSVCLF